MKAIIWKELRELAPRSVALLLLTLTPVVIALYSSGVEIQGEVRVLTREVVAFLVFVSALAACALGILQTLFDIRRDQWAFLIHRGESATRIFLAKVIAAGLIYAVVTLLPILTCVVWGMRGGIERFPFSWYLLVPMLAAIVSAIPFYFATLLAMRWQALWRANYLLPIAAPFLSPVAFGIAMTYSEFISPQIFLYSLLLAGVLGIAAWGAFVRSGEAPGRPFLATVCLGMQIYFTILLGLFLCLVAVEMGLASLLGEEPSEESRHRIITHLHINKEGHVVAVTESRTPNPNRQYGVISDIRDLDGPRSRRYDSLNGQEAYLFYRPPSDVIRTIRMFKESNKELNWGPWEPLLTANFRVTQDAWWNSNFNSASQQRLLEEIGLLNANSPTRWIFSSADGLIYGYEQTYKTDELMSRPEPPRLIKIVCPDGFLNPGQIPQRRFSRLLMNHSSASSRSTMSVWPELRNNGLDKGLLVGPGCYLVCEDAIYCVDSDNRKVYELHVAPAGKKIRYLASLIDDFVVVYNDSIAVHELRHDPILKSQNLANPANLPLPGKLKFIVPIPREVLYAKTIEFGQLPNRSGLIFVGKGEFDRPYRVVRTRMDGTILSSRDYSQTTTHLQGKTFFEQKAAVLLPPGLTALWFAGNAAFSAASGRGPGTIATLWRYSRDSFLSILGWMTVITAICVVSAMRTARRYGFSIQTRRIWQGIALCLGPAGLLTLWFLRDWPACEVCEACRMKRPVNLETCPNCGKSAQPLPDARPDFQISERGVSLVT